MTPDQEHLSPYLRRRTRHRMEQVFATVAEDASSATRMS